MTPSVVSGGAEAALTVVGAGTLLPDPHRASPSFHVRVEAPTRHGVLMDVGPGTLHGLPRAGVDWRAIGTVALTHFHPDHLSDLPALLAAYRYDAAVAPLTIVGPCGLQSRLEAMAVLHGSWILAPGRPLTVVELGPEGRWVSDCGSVRLDVHDTPHTSESVAYRLTSPADGESGSVFVIGYTGDTGPSSSLAGFLKGCDVLIAECALVDPPELDTHLSPSGVARLAEEAKPDLLLLSHVYPPQRPADAVEAVRRAYSGRVRAARDGAVVRITASGVAMDRLDDAP